MNRNRYDKYLYLLLGITACITFFLVAVNVVFYGLSVSSFGSDLAEGHFSKVSYPRAFVVESGSMEPAIPTASVVFTLPQKNYQVGDVISFTQSRGDTVTHRVAGLNESGYATRGDANEEPDVGTVASESVIGEVVFTIPGVGKAVNKAKSPQGFILLVIVPATIIIYEELRSLGGQVHVGAKKVKGKFTRGPTSSSRGRTSEGQRRRLPSATIVIPILGALAVIVGFTGSYLFDLETVIGNSATVTVPTPTPTPVLENNQIQAIESLDSEPLTLTLTPTP